MKRTFTPLLLALFGAALASGADKLENLVRAPGSRLSADCHFNNFTPEKAADGDSTSKASRWVSRDNTKEHWIAVEFDRPKEVNQVSLQFWNRSHISVDYDIQVRIGDSWKTVGEVRGNREEKRTTAFPTTETRAVRIRFLKQIPDNMVRLYEFSAARLPHPVEVSFDDAISGGLLIGRTPSLRLINREPGTTVEILVKIRLLSGDGRTMLKESSGTCTLRSAASVPLPVPESYGPCRYEISLLENPVDAVSLPPAESPYRSSSPFGAHYHNSADGFVTHAGIHWWRNHDIYGRWSDLADEKGRMDWSNYRERLAFVRKNQIRECSVYLGAPRAFSTILPGEPVIGPQDWNYSYYPPSDFDAWVNQYLLPVAEMVKKASPFRAHEVWNEAWSYYRLRGLHGTAGEAMNLFRISYEALKKADPEALVYATDIKPEIAENRYAFRNFGRDLFDLGYLRWNDLLSYHSYGIMTYPRLEKIRRNAWNYGRDFDLWSTETAVEGQPAYTLLESIVSHRAAGNGKTFLYTGDLWAPLMLDGKPTLYLVAQAALCRNLGDALPLGNFKRENVRIYLFANGKDPAAVLFTDSQTPVKLPLASARTATAEDMFGRKLEATGPILSRETPVFLRDVPDAMVRAALAEQIAFHSSEPEGKRFRPLVDKLLKCGDKQFASLLDREIAAVRTMRRSATSEQLYVSNKVLDLLVHARIMLARRSGTGSVPAADLPMLRRTIAAAWKAAAARTAGEGALLDTERLISRAQKEMQFAAMYASDGDTVARDLFAACAADDLANAETRLPRENVTKLYKPKSYFRSHKRLIRSELYCFPNGRPQEAVVTLANPFGRELSASLAVTLPAGWKAAPERLTGKVPPFSRLLLKLEITAPEKFTPGEKAKILLRDETGNFPPLEAECEVLGKIPAYPVLGGPISGGEFTGN